MRIKSITEANSMQPNTWSVCTRENDYPLHKSIVPHKHKPDCIFRIEKIQIEQYEWIYVAYDFQDRKLFEWQSKSVNVEFYYPEEK
jgi:hypothetical protein